MPLGEPPDAKPLVSKRLIRVLGVILGIALAVALGLWFGGVGCAFFTMVNQHRPPVMVHMGAIYRPQPKVDNVADVFNQNVNQWNMLGRLTIPTKPVGVWADVIYGLGQDRVTSTSFGFFVTFPPGPEGPKPVGQEEEESIVSDPAVGGNP